MATGDAIAIDWNKATVNNFLLRFSGIDGDYPLENFTVDATNNRWSATPVGGLPNLSHINGTLTNPGAVQLVSAAAPNQIEDVEGNLLAPGTVVFNRAITIAPPTVRGTVTATYLSGLGDASLPITAGTDLTGNAPIVINVSSVEN
ncbi:MAG: hypothetical protein AAFW67_11155 [Cyanobacteria bacterium J06638_38]